MTLPLEYDFTMPTSVAAGAAAKDVIFEDHFWGDVWWTTLRDASRLRHITETIQLDPVPDAARTRKELDALLKMQESDERSDRRAAITAENSALPVHYASILLTDPPGNQRTDKLIKAAIVWSRGPIMALKFKYKRPRPSQLEPRIKPMLELPRHPAYPSGHSTQFHLIAHVIGSISGNKVLETALLEFAADVALNREYAGFHYESDSKAGKVLAAALAPHFLKQFEREADDARTEWQ